MAERPNDDRARAASEGMRAQRFRVVLLVLTLFGAPLVLMVSYLWMRNAAFLPPYGEQPGGRVAGLVSLEDGKPAAAARVRVYLHPRDQDPSLRDDAKTGEDGRFSVEVPPLDGCYTVVVGGGTWVAVRREVSLLEGDPQALEFTLAPGCEVALKLTRRDGIEIVGGHFELLREAKSFLPVPSAALTGRFEGPTIECDGLPPGSWKLSLRLDDGTEAEYQLTLEPGRTELSLEPF